jgi:hypothetical protein
LPIGAPTFTLDQYRIVGLEYMLVCTKIGK